MREIRVSSTLTVYFDGQFWVGMFERVEGGSLSACRVVFGSEPSDEEILRFIVERYNRLRFSDPVAHEGASRQSTNPKRRQREASRELSRRGPSTKAQQAISEEREANAQKRKSDARERREREKSERFEQRQQKRKQTHRGR